MFFQIISDFENNAGRNKEKLEGRPFPQPLMHFCFDILGQDTVAVTCPKEEWSKLSPIPKCCPKDQVIFEETCVNKNQNDPEWTVSLDGYLYNASYLIEQGKMKFDQSKSDIFSGQKCSSDKKFPADAFHIGQDGKLHSTEIHPELDALDYFCIDFEREQYDEDDEYDEEDEEEGKDCIISKCAHLHNLCQN